MDQSSPVPNSADAGPIEALLVESRPPTRPGAMTAICVILLVVASLGILSSFAQSVNLVFGQQMQKVWSNMGSIGATPDMKEAQQRMMTSMQKLTDDYFVANMVIVIAQWLLSFAFLYGAIQSLRLQRPGREVLCWALLGACIFEAGRAVPQFMLQLGMRPIMEEYTRTMIPPSANPQQQAGARVGAAAVQAGMMAGLVMTLCWVVIKIAFYAYSFRYLSKREIQRLFPSGSGA